MNNQSRRILGALFGAGIGLVYGLVAQSVNLIALPRLSIYQPPPGRLTSIAMVLILGSVLGFIAAWPEDAIPGILYSSLAGITIVSIYGLIADGGGSEAFIGGLLVFFLTFLPRAFLFLPLAILVRWILSIWQNELQTVEFSVRKMALSLFLILLFAAGGGLLSLYPRQAREALRTMDDLIQVGMQSASEASLPDSLRPVDGFYSSARGSYVLEVSDDPDNFPIARLPTSYNEVVYAVLARFENGYRFACVFIPDVPRPACGNY